jgi:hypothetical protein
MWKEIVTGLRRRPGIWPEGLNEPTDIPSWRSRDLTHTQQSAAVGT